MSSSTPFLIGRDDEDAGALLDPSAASDFRSPPAAPGCIYYERFDWGLDSATWCRYTEEALTALQIAPAAASHTAGLWL